jgi:DNA-dependent RNA polymerase auxiliary subunit epsilon
MVLYNVSGSTRVDWDENAERCLIAGYTQRQHLFNDSITAHQTLWNEIVVDLQKIPFPCTTEKARRKFQKLKGAYYSAVDASKKTGNSPVYYEYFDEFHELFAKSHSVNPFIGSSRRMRPFSQHQSNYLEYDEGAEEEEPHGGSAQHFENLDSNQVPVRDVTNSFFAKKRHREPKRVVFGNQLNELIKQKKLRLEQDTELRREFLDLEREKFEFQKKVYEASQSKRTGDDSNSS